MALLQPVQPSAEALKQGYEPVGVSFKAIVWSLVILALVVTLFMGIAVWLILAFVHHNRQTEAIRSTVPTAPLDTGLPPLQPSVEHNRTDAQDLVALRQHEDEVFSELGWKMGDNQRRQVPDDILNAVAARQGPNKAGR